MSSAASRGDGGAGGQPALVERTADGAIVLIRGSMVDALGRFMAITGGGLGTEANVAAMAGRFAGMGTERGLLLYKSGDAQVKKLSSGKDALAGAASGDWDEPCYLVMFRG